MMLIHDWCRMILGVVSLVLIAQASMFLGHLPSTTPIEGLNPGRGAQGGANEGTPAADALPGHGHDPQSSSAAAPARLQATDGQPTQPVDGEGEGSTGG